MSGKKIKYLQSAESFLHFFYKENAFLMKIRVVVFLQLVLKTFL